MPIELIFMLERLELLPMRRSKLLVCLLIRELKQLICSDIVEVIKCVLGNCNVIVTLENKEIDLKRLDDFE